MLKTRTIKIVIFFSLLSLSIFISFFLFWLTFNLTKFKLRLKKNILLFILQSLEFFISFSFFFRLQLLLLFLQQQQQRKKCVCFLICSSFFFFRFLEVEVVRFVSSSLFYIVFFINFYSINCSRVFYINKNNAYKKK